MAFAIGFVAIVFMSFGIERLWSKYLNTKLIRTFLFPGAAIHDLSHAVLCLVTRTTIKEFVFKLENSSIEYDKPRVPVLFDFFISTSPIFGCAFVLILISLALGNPIQVNEPLPNEMIFSLKAVFDYAKTFLDIIWLTLNGFWKNGFNTVGSAIFMVASIIFTVSMAPHKGDIKYIVLGFITIGLILFGLDLAGLSLLGFKWWTNTLDESWRIITYIISVLITVLFITVICVGVINGVKLTFGLKDGEKGS